MLKCLLFDSDRSGPAPMLWIALEANWRFIMDPERLRILKQRQFRTFFYKFVVIQDIGFKYVNNYKKRRFILDYHVKKQKINVFKNLQKSEIF